MDRLAHIVQMDPGKKHQHYNKIPRPSFKIANMDYSKDFLGVIATRSMSTSTPMATRSLSSSASSPGSEHDDSGYPESIAESRLNDTAFLDTTTMTANTHLASADCDADVNLVYDATLCDLCEKDECACGPTVEIMGWQVPHNNAHRKPPSIYPKHSLESFESSDLDTSFGASALSEQMDCFVLSDVLQHFSPRVPDRLIGRKMGLEKVDILSELSTLSVPGVSLILGYLEPVDLCRVHMVCCQWRALCAADGRARGRRRKYLAARKGRAHSFGKENNGKIMKRRQLRSFTTGDVLTTVQPTQTPRSPVKTPVANLFAQAASNLRTDETLRHCPNCHSAAKLYAAQNRGVCLRQMCTFDFCVKCFCEYHGARNCIPLAAKKSKLDSVGSKKSKRNLHRL